MTYYKCLECDGDEPIEFLGEDLLSVCPLCRTIEGKIEEIEDEDE